MYNKTYHNLAVRKSMKRLGLSERALSDKAQLSRTTLRSIVAEDSSVTLKNLEATANALGLSLIILATPTEMNADFSTIAVSLKVIRDGPLSWKIHFMDFIDEFRRSLDPRLFLLSPSIELSLRLRGLLASMVITLCDEAGMMTPAWAVKRFDLPAPWFVSEMESLKAMALLESPLAFRRNSIFVHSNFMERV